MSQPQSYRNVNPSSSSPLSSSPPGQGFNTPALSNEELGDRLYAQIPKMSAEFFAITYGAFVKQILAGCNDRPEAANTQLEEAGAHIGVKLVEEYFARVWDFSSGSQMRCSNFSQTCDSIAKVALKMFLGINATSVALIDDAVADQRDSVDGKAPQAYSILFQDNPLNIFVELPEHLRDTLWYSNIICGVIRGALEQIGMQATVSFVKDVLRGDSVNEIKIALLKENASSGQRE